MFIGLYPHNTQVRSGLYKNVVTRCQAESSRYPRDTETKQQQHKYSEANHKQEGIWDWLLVSLLLVSVFTKSNQQSCIAYLQHLRA